MNIVNEKIAIKQTLYVKEVERLIMRPADILEIIAIKSAYSRHRSSIETAKLLSRSSDRVDRQNDLA